MKELLHTKAVYIPMGSRRELTRPPYRDLLTGIAGGLLASAVTGGVDRILTRFVSEEQKRRERKVRAGSAHEVAGPMFGKKIAGRRLTRREKRRAQVAFTMAYGVGWGLVYALVRRKVHPASRLAGIPFAVPFFAVCDGALAPMLGLSPGLERVPWQFNAKELANHIVWTASAEMVHRIRGSTK